MKLSHLDLSPFRVEMLSLWLALSLLSVCAERVERGKEGNLEQIHLLGPCSRRKASPGERWLQMSTLPGMVKYERKDFNMQSPKSI